MKIRLAGPIEGKRRHIFRGEEAAVSRLTSGPYEGLVERVQTFGKPDFTHEFSLHMGMYRVNYPNNQLEYLLLNVAARQILHALSLGTNAPIIHELRISTNPTRTYEYTEYVPDTTDTMTRKKAAMAKFKNARKKYAKTLLDSDEKIVRTIRDQIDAQERTLLPGLKDADAWHENGIYIAHPEVNYHVRKGRPMFFEIGGIEIESLSDSIRRTKNVQITGRQEFLDAINDAIEYNLYL